jgi:hypothetical protein
MERFLVSCVAVACMVACVGIVIWPAWVISLSRDHGDTRPATSGEAWLMRVLGIIFAVAAGYGLYALVTGMPGAADLNV